MRFGKLDPGEVKFGPWYVAGNKPFLQKLYLFGADMFLRVKQVQTARGQKIIQESSANATVEFPSRIGEVESRSFIETASRMDAVTPFALRLERNGKVEGEQIRAGNARRKVEYGIGTGPGGHYGSFRLLQTSAGRLHVRAEVQGDQRCGLKVPKLRRPGSHRLAQAFLHERLQSGVFEAARFKIGSSLYRRDRSRLISLYCATRKR